MLILGLHDGHNAAACLLRDGEILGALQEERPRRIKNYHGFPHQAVARLLHHHGVHWRELDAVVLAGRESYAPPGGENDRRAQMRAYKAVCRPAARLRGLLRHTPLRPAVQAARQRRRLSPLLAQGVPAERIHWVAHHRCHAATAWFGPGMDAAALVVTADGAGDGLCATVSRPGGEGGLERLLAVPEGHSLGILWAVLTSLLGMVPLEHEYKLMGMAPYADPRRARRVRDVIAGAFTRHGRGWRRRPGVPEMNYSYEYWRRRLEFARFDEICAGLQAFTEEFVCDWIAHWLEESGRRRLRLSGGLFMNVKLNQRIAQLPQVEDLYVFPSCGDETNAIGAAWAWLADRGRAEHIRPLGPYYLGVPPADGDYQAAAARAAAEGLQVRRPSDLAGEVVALLLAGEVVARFDGAEEFGARALGNRSLLADPARDDVVRTLNRAIKSRDFWMPFACSVLDGYADRYLYNPKDLAAPYMILTFDSRHTDEIRAGTHPEDGSVRPQVVTRDWAPAYHQLLSRFAEASGRGALLNTSFNLHGEPIVSTPDEAVDVLRRSGLRHLALGSFLISKPGAGS